MDAGRGVPCTVLGILKQVILIQRGMGLDVLEHFESVSHWRGGWSYSECGPECPGGHHPGAHRGGAGVG